MSKAILVIDMPRCCKECLLILRYGNCFCVKELRECSGKDKNVRKPDWCPLREVPQKKELYLAINSEKGYCEGYNACIDEIGGGANETDKETHQST